MDAYFIGLTFSSKIFKQTDAGSRLFIKEGRSMTDKPCRSVCISAPGYSGRLCARDRIFGKVKRRCRDVKYLPAPLTGLRGIFPKELHFFTPFKLTDLC